MNSIDLAPYEFLLFHPGKGDRSPSKCISVLRLREIDRIQNRLTGRAVLFYADFVNAPTIWTMQSGEKLVRDISYKKAKTITHVVSDGPFTGLFYLSKKGVEFLLQEHVPDRPWKLRSKPRNFSDDLNALMTSCYGQRSNIKKKKDVAQGFFIVYNAQLKYFATNGALILAVLVRDTQEGGLHLLVGCLARKLWQRWDVEEDYGVNSGIYIDPNGDTVTLLRCAIGAPVEVMDVERAVPTTSFSLTVFDLIEPSIRRREVSQSNSIACAFYHEVTVSLTGQHSLKRRTFQSLGFIFPPSESDGCLNCPVAVESTPIPLFSFLMRVGSESFILQLTYSSNEDELVAECHTLPGELQISNPLALSTMQVNGDLQQPGGSRVTFILTKDLKLFAFDGVSSVEVRVVLASDTTNDIEYIGQQMASRRKLPKHQKQLRHSDFKAGIPAAADEIRLLPVGLHELLCTDGRIAVFLHLTGVNLQSASLNEKMVCITSDILEPKSGDESVLCEKALALLSDILASEPVTRRELGEILLRRITQTLRRASKMQIYIPLVRRIFVLLLRLFSPVTDTDWQDLWTLTRILQHTIDRRICTNSIACTDQFFVNLIEQYYPINLNPKIEPHTRNLKLDEIVLSRVKHTEEDEHNYKEDIFSTEALFFLDGLAKRVPLLSFAEEVVRRCVVLDTFSSGCVRAVLPKEGCGTVIHAMGVVLLSSSLNIHLFFGVDNKNKSITWSDEQVEPSCISVPAYPFDDPKKVECAFTLAVDLMCVQTASLPYSFHIPIVALTVSQRRHCLISLLKLFLPQILQSLHTDSLSLSNNTEWLETCATTLNADPIEVVRTFIQAPMKGVDQRNTSTATALFYALCGTELPNNLSLFYYIQESISQELCVASIVVLIFTMTEKLVDARNSYTASVMKHLLDKHENDTRESEGFLACREHFCAAIEHTLVAWVQASVVLPYTVHDIAASYQSSISMSFSSSICLADNRGTVVLRTLILCFRIFVLVYYSQILEQRLEKTVLLCKQDVESHSDINESHPAVHGSLGALCTIYTLKHSGLPVERSQEQLLELIKEASEICVSDKHPKSEPWRSFFAHVLSLSGISDTTMEPLKKIYFTLLDRLQNETNKLSNHEEIGNSIRNCIEIANSTVSALSPENGDESQAFYFIFSHSRDSSIPRWIRDQGLPGRKYMISTDWTQRMWSIEGKANASKEAIELLVSSIEEGSKRAALRMSEKESDGLSTVQAKPLFENIFHILLPTQSREETECPIPPREVQNSYYLPKERTHDVNVEVGSIDKEVTAVKAPSREEPSVARNTPATISPESIVETAKAEKISSRTRSPSLMHSPADSTLTASNRLASQDITQRRSLSPRLPKGYYATADSMEEEPALSDTATTRTTSTSQCLTGTDDSQKSIEKPLRSYNESNYEEGIFASSRVKYHKKRCHHHHHHCSYCCCRCNRSCGQSDSCRIKLGKGGHGWIGEDPAVRIDNTLTPTKLPLYSHEFHGDLHSNQTVVPHQQSNTALRPPPEPPRKSPMDDFQTPIYQRIGTIPSNVRQDVAQDSSGGPSLLTFSHHQGQQSRSPRVKLYSIHLGDSGTHMKEIKQTTEWMGTTAPSPFLNNVTAHTGVQYLEPPPIPSSCVFQKPPPLLHLREHVAIGESGAAAVAENNFPNQCMSSSPYISTFPDANFFFDKNKAVVSASRSPQQLQQLQPSQERTERAPEQLLTSFPELNLSAQVSREQTVPMPRDDVEPVLVQPVLSTSISEHHIGNPQSDAKSFTVPDVKQSFLTSAEMHEFKRYVDNLVTKISLAPSAPVPGVTTNFTASPLETGDFSREKQQQALPAWVDNSLSQQAENIVLNPQIPKPPQSTSAPEPVVHPPPLFFPHAQNGLAPLEQAQLVQESVRQKNELLNLNLELSEIRLRAARIGGSSAFEPTVIKVESTDNLLSYNRDQPLSQMQPSCDSTKSQPMLSAQIQTQPLATSDASVGASLTPFHLMSTMPSSGVTTAVPEVSIANTISDLEGLNSKLQAINCSAEAMEKALHDTRETIRSYEKLKATEGMKVEEIALLNSLRCKTAAAERRLAELHRLPMATQVQSSPLEFQPQSPLKLCSGGSAGFVLPGHDGVTESEINAQRQNGADPAERRFISFSTCETGHPEEAKRAEIDLAKQQPSDVTASALCNSSAPDPRALPLPSFEMDRTRQLAPQPAPISPWNPYQTSTFVSPTTREYLTVKETVWKDVNEGEHATRATVLTDSKQISSVNSQRGLSVCQGAPSYKSCVEAVPESNVAPSFVELTDLHEVYQSAPKRPSERIRHQRCRAPLYPQRSCSALERRRRTTASGAATRQLRSRTATKDLPDRFYMYRSQSSIPKTNQKPLSRAKTQKYASPLVSCSKSAFGDSVNVAVSNGVLSSEDGGQLKVNVGSTFVERQRRRRSDNIEKRIHQLDREFA
ncbi:unnamed protein product [Phytomonas sp. EM1]|nr:unnamed protein product [Phytomonas sp. EM1]|eukprot:CCW64798.1 unnamed protein product [Phytomonas sp. isolate EM1]